MNLTTPPDPDLRPYGELMMRLSVMGQLFTTRMDQRLQALDLTVAQYGILNHIARVQADGLAGAGLRISDIAAAVEVQQPAVTKAVTKFENMGLVSTAVDRDDKRTRLVLLTDKGFGLLAGSRQLFREEVMAFRQLFSPEEVGRLNAGLARLTGWLDTNRL